MPHYVYLLRCRDGSLYTGYTTDIKRRLKQHQDGKAAKYTRGRRPVVLLGQQEYSSRGEALAAEIRIKKMNRKEKLRALLNNPNDSAGCS